MIQKTLDRSPFKVRVIVKRSPIALRNRRNIELKASNKKYSLWKFLENTNRTDIKISKNRIVCLIVEFDFLESFQKKSYAYIIFISLPLLKTRIT